MAVFTTPYAAFAFETLASQLRGFSPLPLARFLEHLALKGLPELAPLFVTWNVIGPQGKELRGCIGTFSALKLDSGVKEYAAISAFEDLRFEPIEAHELPRLECAVTLLTDFEESSGIFDWQIGKHGIQITFEYNKRHYSGTFLPEVAAEQGWSQVETLQYLIRKAGLNKPAVARNPDTWPLVLKLRVVRYQGLKQTLRYTDYEAVRRGIVETQTDEA